MSEIEGADVSPDEIEEVTAEAEAETEETGIEQENEAESPAADEKTVEKKMDPVQARIDELTKNWRETQRALDQREREVEEYRRKAAAIPEPVEEVKSLADFEYDDKAYQSYIFNESRKQGELAAQKVLEGWQGKQNAENAESKFRAVEAAFAANVKDYNDAVYDRSLKISGSMAEAARSSDIGPEILYHLAKNPDLAAGMYNLSASAAGREMGRLEARLEAAKQKASEKAVSNAPAPAVTKLKGASASQKVSTTEASSDELSDDEWFKREDARLKKLRG